MTRTREIAANPELCQKIDRAYKLWAQIKQLEVEYATLQDVIRAEVTSIFDDEEKSVLIKTNAVTAKVTKKNPFLIDISGEHFNKLRNLLGPEKFNKLFKVQTELIPTKELKEHFNQGNLTTYLDQEQAEKLEEVLEVRGGSIAILFPDQSPRKI